MEAGGETIRTSGIPEGHKILINSQFLTTKTRMRVIQLCVIPLAIESANLSITIFLSTFTWKAFFFFDSEILSDLSHVVFVQIAVFIKCKSGEKCGQLIEDFLGESDASSLKKLKYKTI